MMEKQMLAPTSPGEMLSEEFLKPLGLTQYQLSKAIKTSQMRISEIVRGKRAITPNTALRLARYFGNSAEFWMNLQAGYELKMARREFDSLIKKEVKPYEQSDVKH